MYIIGMILSNQTSNIVFSGSFKHYKAGSPVWKKDWGIAFTARVEDARVIASDYQKAGSHCLRVSYPKTGVGPAQTGVQFPVAFNSIDTMPIKQFNSLYLRYYLMFEPDFDFRLGGKLPGLMGGGSSWLRSGGDQPDGTNGWTMRFMWRKEGKAVVYAYIPSGKYGGTEWGLDIDLNFSFIPGKWHCIEEFIRINDIGKQNGELSVWIDDQLNLNINDIVYRTVENDAGKIGGIYFSTFHGGNTADWGPVRDSYIRFGSFVASTGRLHP